MSIWFSTQLASRKVKSCSEPYLPMPSSLPDSGVFVRGDETKGYDFKQKISCKVPDAVF